MTDTATEPLPAATNDTWTEQLVQLKARYKHVREPVLAALNILIHDQDSRRGGDSALAAWRTAR